MVVVASKKLEKNSRDCENLGGYESKMDRYNVTDVSVSLGFGLWFSDLFGKSPYLVGLQREHRFCNKNKRGFLSNLILAQKQQYIYIKKKTTIYI